MTPPTPAQVAALKELGFRAGARTDLYGVRLSDGGYLNCDFRHFAKNGRPHFFVASKPNTQGERELRDAPNHPLALAFYNLLIEGGKTTPAQPPALLKEPAQKQTSLSPQHIPQIEGGGGASGAGLSEVMPPPSHPPTNTVEVLARKFHALYQEEAKRQGDMRHSDDYDTLSEGIKEYDRVLARYVLAAFQVQSAPDVGDIYIKRANKGGLWRTYRFSQQDYERIEADTLARNAAIAKKIFLAVAGDRKEGERRTADLPILVAQAAPLIDHALTHPWHAFNLWADGQIYSGAKASEEELRERGECDAKEP